MLTTDQLEKRIKKIIYRVLPNADMDSIYFSIGTANSPEGAYFFSRDNKYYYVFTEKGTIRNHEELETEDEIL